MRFAILSCNLVQLMAVGTHRFSFALTQTERLVHAVTCILTTLLLATVFEKYVSRSKQVYRVIAAAVLSVVALELAFVGSKAFTGAWSQRELLLLGLVTIIGAFALIKKSLQSARLNRSLISQL